MLSRGVASIRSPRVPPKGMRKSLTSLIIGSLVSGPHSEFLNLCSDASLTVDNWRMAFQQILFPGTVKALHYRKKSSGQQDETWTQAPMGDTAQKALYVTEKNKAVPTE